LTPDVRADLLLSIEQDTARMARFLANITDLTRLESGEVRPRLAALDVVAVIEAAVARVPDALHVGVSLPDLPPRVLADPALLEQVLVNLLDNAAKYSHTGAVTVVRVGTRRGPSNRAEVSIAVADEGVGIAADDLPHVFDSFYRARRGDRVAPGTGLGLAIARGMVEAMDGRIEAASPRLDLPRDGSPGAVVTVWLPAVP
jgi:two-component system sensor histidine kinase KdpD